MNSRIFHSIHLDHTNNRSESIFYILLPRQLEEEEKDTLDRIAGEYEVNIVLISDFDLTHEHGRRNNGPMNFTRLFEGKATTFLQDLCNDLFFNIENSLCINKPRRNLIGIEEFGLFAIWSTTQKHLFDYVGSIAGTFGYEGFTEWLSGQPDLLCSHFYITPGPEEKNQRNKKSQEESRNTTEAVMAVIRDFGKEVISAPDTGSEAFEITDHIEFILKQFSSDDENL